MLTNLKIYDITSKLESIPSLLAMFPWGITNEKPLGENLFPYLYATKFEYMERNNLTKRAHIELSIVWSPDTVSDELEDMFIVIDNHLLADVDGCLPIVQWWDTTVIDIAQWSMSKAMRDAKESIVIRKTYNFTYLTQN